MLNFKVMVTKLFPSDKNYILKQIQEDTRDQLQVYLVEYVKEFYLQYHNPLGLIDKTIIKVKNSKDYPLHPLNEFYFDLSAIYRYQFGEVQLEFSFDGKSLEEKYEEQWTKYFKSSIKRFSYNINFLKAVLEISVFHPKGKHTFLAGQRMKYFIEHYFDLKVYRYKGIQKLKAS